MQILRSKMVAQMESWVGCNEADGSHKKIIDLYNSQKKLPAGYKVKYTDAWCATTLGAAAVACGYDEVFPQECSCNRLIELFKKADRWMENDAYVPKPGDYIFYDWDDDGKGDCTGGSEHVGLVIRVENGKITIIEGNKKDAVGYRTIEVNGRYIRGYGLPPYTDDTVSTGTSTSTAKTETSKTTTTSKVTTPTKEVKAKTGATNKNTKYSGTYKVIAESGLHIRHGAGTKHESMGILKKGTKVINYGYYSKDTNGSVWLYVQVTVGNTKYTGFCSAKYLQKI